MANEPVTQDDLIAAQREVANLRDAKTHAAEAVRDWTARLHADPGLLDYDLKDYERDLKIAEKASVAAAMAAAAFGRLKARFNDEQAATEAARLKR